MMEEVWKDILNFEGFYQVSNLGKIKSIERTYINSLGRKYIVREKILNAPILNNGYVLYTLYNNEIRKQLSGHRIVAQTFLDKEEGRDLVNHKNGIRHDNRAENLEWTSNRENQAHYQKVLLNSEKKFGANYIKSSNKWSATIMINSKQIHLGNFTTEEEAHQAYQKALIDYGLQNKYAA